MSLLKMFDSTPGGKGFLKYLSYIVGQRTNYIYGHWPMNFFQFLLRLNPIASVVLVIYFKLIGELWQTTR